MAKLKYAYYPGCASQEITKEADSSTRLVAKALGIELVPMPKANCCGAGLLADYDYTLHLAMNARIFAEAEEMGMDILTICSTCLMVMRTANHELRKDPGLLQKINRVLSKAGLRYSGGIETKHLLWVLIGDYGMERLKKKVSRPLAGLKVAPFYGCHSLRPSRVMGFEDPDRPSSLETIIETLGASPVEYSGKTKCCGFQADLVNADTAVEMTGRRLSDAKGSGADCMVTPCPFCHINLDDYQDSAEKMMTKKIGLPIFHLAQIVGLSMGMSAEDMGLSRHLVSPEKTLSKY